MAPTDDSNASFWKTLPGMLTAAAGLISAAAGLVIALNQAGLFAHNTPAANAKPAAVADAADATPAAAAAANVVAIGGAWRASVTYDWGATYTERFAFQVDKGKLTGTVTYLGSPRGIQSGVVAGDDLTFTVRAEEILGDQTRPYTLSYSGTAAGGGIRFVLEDSRGTPPVQFAAARALPQ